jgi:hypothetical protein
MDTKKLLEIVQQHEWKDMYTLAKAIEQEERTYLSNLVSELWFPWIIPLIENN